MISTIRIGILWIRCGKWFDVLRVDTRQVLLVGRLTNPEGVVGTIPWKAVRRCDRIFSCAHFKFLEKFVNKDYWIGGNETPLRRWFIIESLPAGRQVLVRTFFSSINYFKIKLAVYVG